VVQGKKNTNKSFEHTLNITKQAPLFMEPTASFFCKEKRLRKEGGEEALAGSLLVAPKASKAIDGWMEDRWEDELLFPFPLQDKPHPILSCHFSSSSSLLLLKLKHPSPTTYYYSSPQTNKLGDDMDFFAARPSPPLSVHAKKPIYHRIQNEQT